MKINNECVINAGEQDYTKVSFDWSVIDLCNYNCSYCFAGFGDKNKNKQSNFFSDKNINSSYKHVLRKLSLSRLPEFEVSLVGGEPTLHPNIDTIVSRLNDCERCTDVSIITNTFKPIDYFNKLNDLNLEKLSVCSSIHLDYFKIEDLNKYRALSRLENIKYQAIVMLHDDPSYVDSLTKILNYFEEENVSCSVTFLESHDTYKPSYNTIIYNTINDYKDLLMDNRYVYSTRDDTYKLSKNQINAGNYKTFKGWRCKPLLWTIDVDGVFRNACTKETPSLLFDNLCDIKMCPLDTCSCDIKWRFPKNK